MKYISKFLIPWVSCLTLLLATAAHTEIVHIAHCQLQCPSLSSASNEVVVRHLFAASINPQTGLAEWVAYRVIADAVGVASLLPRWWQADELLELTPQPDTVTDNGPRLLQPDLSNAQDRDYRVNEFSLNLEDRGRLTPMTSFANTPYWSELNNLSNMAPIPTSLRVGSWARLEQAVNELAAEIGNLYVISGPLYESGAIQTQPDGTILPSAYFKLISSENRYAAFVFDHDIPQQANFCEQLDSLQWIEQSTGLTLFPVSLAQRSADLAAELGCVAN